MRSIERAALSRGRTRRDDALRLSQLASAAAGRRSPAFGTAKGCPRPPMTPTHHTCPAPPSGRMVGMVVPPAAHQGPAAHIGRTSAAVPAQGCRRCRRRPPPAQEGRRGGVAPRLAVFFGARGELAAAARRRPSCRRSGQEAQDGFHEMETVQDADRPLSEDRTPAVRLRRCARPTVSPLPVFDDLCSVTNPQLPGSGCWQQKRDVKRIDFIGAAPWWRC